MADKFISAYSKSTAPSKTDKLITEASTDGVYLHQDREQLHTLYTGEQIDSASGVDLLLKAGASASITVTAGTGAVAFSKVVTMAGQLQTAAVIRAAAGIRESGNLEFFGKGRFESLQLTQGLQGIVIPALPKGSTAAAVNVEGYSVLEGSLGPYTTTVKLVTPAGTVYSSASAAVTFTNLGEDQSAALQTAVDAAAASFLSGEGRVVAPGDGFLLSGDSVSNSRALVATIEVVYT